MARLIQIPLGVRSNPARVGQAGVARLVNCYMEEQGAEGKSAAPIWASDGFDLFATMEGSGGVRAALVVDEALYVVHGRLLSRVDASGGVTTIGGISADGPVFMDRNRAAPLPEVAIVCSGLYWLARGTTLTQIETPNLRPPIAVAWQNGYFLLPAASGTWQWTAIDDGATVAADDIATAESDPDGLISVAVRERDILLFGKRSLEVWQDTGDVAEPYQRAAAKQIGCVAARSVVPVQQTVGWVADDGTVRLLSGYEAQQVSSHAVERSIASEADRSAIVGYAWTERGHQFVGWSGSGFTWVFDVRSGKWHERESAGISRWRAATVTDFNGQIIIGDYANPKLYRMSPTAYSEAGEHLIATVQTPFVHNYPNPLRFRSLFVDAVPGVGLNTTNSHNADPKIMVSWTADGRQWAPERLASVGRIGEFKRQVRINRLGMSREDGLAFRFRMSAAVIKGLTSAAALVDNVEA